MPNYKPWAQPVSVGSGNFQISIKNPSAVIALHADLSLGTGDKSLYDTGTNPYQVPSGKIFRAMQLYIHHTSVLTMAVIREGTLLNNGGTGKYTFDTRDGKTKSSYVMNETFTFDKYVTIGSISAAGIYHIEIIGYEEDA